VFVTLLGYALANDEALQRRVIDTVASQFPVAGSQIRDSVRTIQGSGIGLVIGFVGTLWGGLGITNSAQDAMNTVWAIPRRDRPSLWWRLARSLGVLLLLAAGIFAATALAGSGALSPGSLSRLLPLAGAVLVNLLLLTAIFQLLVASRQRWRHLLPGAAVAAVGWSVLQALGAYIVDRQLGRANLVYGVFAVVIGLLSWLYLSAQMVLYAAEVNVVLARRLWPRSLLQAPLTVSDRRVLTALAGTEERLPQETVEVSFSPEPDAHDETRSPPTS
jgi:membrane protein